MLPRRLFADTCLRHRCFALTLSKGSLIFRKVVRSGPDTYGFQCKTCVAGLPLVTPERVPFAPYQDPVKQITCSACGETHGYVGQMVRVRSASQG